MVRLDADSAKKIVDSIREAEVGTSGEIRVHVKRGASTDPLEDARRLFRRLGMHRTKRRNGVLIYVVPKSRGFAIVGDEGIHRIVGGAFWDSARDRMRERFEKGEILNGILAGVESAGAKLKAHFPAEARDKNELPDNVTEG